MKPLRVIELFSGVGAQRMAFNIVSERTGLKFDFVAQCEIDKYAVKSYNAIHGETPNLGDITKVETLPECDILTWSFPCQSLSMAGKKEGMKEGTETESSLAWEVIRLLKCSHRPEWLVMENVPAITYKGNIKDFNQIIKALGNLGYINRYGIFNATDYGVAQDRDRCMMVSHLGGAIPDFPKPIPLKHVIRDYLEPEVDKRYYLSEKRLKGVIAASDREREKGNGFVFDPVPLDGISKTITTKSERKTGTYVLERERMTPPVLVGMLSPKVFKLDIMRRVYSIDGPAPALHTKLANFPFFLVGSE